MSTTAVEILTCPDCRHAWDVHMPARFGGGCGFMSSRDGSCWCDEPLREITPAERRAAIRAQVGTEPLVSRVDDPVTIPVGAVISQRIDPLASHEPITGRVVALWHDEDTGEVGVVLVAPWRKQIRIHRLLVSECVTDPGAVRPPDSVSCANTARAILAVLGGGSSTLSEREYGLLRWAMDLVNIGRAPYGG